MKEESELTQWVALAVLVLIVAVMVIGTGCSRPADPAGDALGATSGALRIDGMLLHPYPAVANGHGHQVARGGNRIAVVESPDTYDGFVHVYHATTGAYLYTVSGISADFSGDRMAVSDAFSYGGVSIRDAGGSVLLAVPSPDPDIIGFGTAVALSGDRLVVAAAYDDAAGVQSAGRVFVLDATSGALLHTLTSPAPAEGDHFGWSLGLSGNLLAVGVSDADDVVWNDSGAVLLFDVYTGALLQTIPSPSPSRTYRFGSTLAVSGDLLSVGAAVATSAYVFASSGALLQTIPDPVPCAGQWACSFSLCSLSLSGNTLAMGSCRADVGGVSQAGAVGLYDAQTGALLSTLENPAPSPGDGFGSSVALYGNQLLVGARKDDLDGVPNGGSAWRFDVTHAGPMHVIPNPRPAEVYEFGRSVALDGDRLAVGHTEDSAPGKVFLYDRATAERLREVTNPTVSSPPDYFGYSVALEGDTALVSKASRARLRTSPTTSERRSRSPATTSRWALARTALAWGRSISSR